MLSRNNQFSVGDRVTISDSYTWAKGALGTVREPPEAVIQLTEDSPEKWNGCSRQMKSLSGLLTLYWVEFDEPHYDADDDGPYSEAEIESQFLIQFAKDTE